GTSNVQTPLLDATKGASVAALAQSIGDTRIDILINNAGVLGEQYGFGTMDYESWTHAFAVNTMGPMRVTEALAGNLSDGAKVITISSQMGSLLRDTSGSYPYRSTKAAVNKVVQLMAHDLKPRGIACITMHPGWVRTDMGGPSASISPQESATGIRQVIDRLTLAETGSFIQWNGETHPW
ncbi:MAG: SDR family NAD(P)-dependent oxidoreductase, partial [Candidatus Phaeomarinobacter sp.]